MPKTSTQINANEKHERFEPRVKSLEKGFKEMIVEFDRMVSYHKSLGTAESAFAKALMKMQEKEVDQAVFKAIEAVSKSVEEVEAERKRVLYDRIHITCSRRAKEFKDGDIAQAQKSLSMIKQKFENYKHARVAYQKPGIDENTYQRLKDRYEEEKDLVKAEEAGFDKTFPKFEKARVVETKELLEEFVRTQIQFHAFGLEQMAKALKAIKKMNPKKAKNAMVDEIVELSEAD